MTRLPLPLELAKPVLLVRDLDEQFGGEYDPTMQLCSSTESEQECESVNSSGVQVDVTVDIQVDDVIA